MAIYGAAALAEIAGCFLFFGFFRLGLTAWVLLPGLVLLALFAYLLTLVPGAAAGRVFAAYGGVYIVASLFWMWLVENHPPDRWDILGAVLCLMGAGVILYGDRAVAG